MISRAIHLLPLILFAWIDTSHAESIEYILYPSKIVRGEKVQVSFYLDNGDTQRVPSTVFCTLRTSSGDRIITASNEIGFFKGYVSLELMIPMDCPKNDDLYFQMGAIHTSGSNQSYNSGEIECLESPVYLLLLIIGILLGITAGVGLQIRGGITHE